MQFQSVLTNPPDAVHVCTFIKPDTGKTARAFSITGLEYLCNNVTGRVSDKNRSTFLKLIKTFKASISSPKSLKRSAALGGAASEQTDPTDQESPDSTQIVSTMRSLPLVLKQAVADVFSELTRTDNNRFDALVEIAKSERSAQTITIDTLKSSLDMTRESTNAFQNQLDIANTKVQDQSVIIAKLNAQLENKQKEIDQLKETQQAISQSQNVGDLPALLHQKGKEIASLQTKNEQQRFILRKLNVELDHTTGERDAALSEAKWLREEAMPELKRENKRLKNELDQWTGMATALDSQ